MDSNGLRFWMLSQLDDWLPPWRANTAYLAGQGIVDPNGFTQLVQAVAPGGRSGGGTPAWNKTAGQQTSDAGITWVNSGPSAAQAGLYYCNASKRLQLRSVRTGNAPLEDFNTATAMVEAVPMAQDQFGNYARWDPSSGHVVAGGSGPSGAPPPDEVPIYTPPQPAVTDLILGYDGILYIAAGGALVMVDRRNRWPNFTLTLPDFNFWRLAALPGGGVLALDRTRPQLGKVAGQPLRTGPSDPPNPGVMRACDPNPDPPRIVSRVALPAEQYVAFAPMDPAQQPPQFALLSWAANTASNQTANLRILGESGAPGAPMQLGGVCLPYAIASIGDQKLAVLATNLNEALIYDLSNAGSALVPAGETYVLAANNAGPFVHGFAMPPDYANIPGATPLMLPLVRLSLNSMAATGATDPSCPAIIDSGISQSVWHRMFIEAILPPRCGGVLWLTASDSLADLANPSSPWYPHILGAADASALPAGAPRAVWQSIPTEVAFAPALLGDPPPVQDRRGLFMVLVQRATKVVRNLTGRYLGVRIQLNGDGRNTPEIAALRVYGSRFSYVQNYLPEIYREAKFGPDADADGNATRHDFFERFVDLFEAQFTRVEDRIAAAYLLTRPESAPDASLDWLGSWIGIPPGGYPPGRRRARIKATPDLYRWRGAPRGLSRALDVATGGLCRSGAIIVIEDFRLRHIFATILGADLSIQDDPLLPGYSPSGNSIVGDTLFIGDPGVQAELQALYATDLDIPDGAEALADFYDRFAHRMTVFIHTQVEDVNINLVRAIVEEEKPAHVRVSIRRATQPLMIGLASLVGVNTYLCPEATLGTATVDASEVGRFDVVTHLPSLDPRLENGIAYQPYAQPIAKLAGPAAVRPGDPIVLDGTASIAPSGSTIQSYQWTVAQSQP